MKTIWKIVLLISVPVALLFIAPSLAFSQEDMMPNDVIFMVDDELAAVAVETGSFTDRSGPSVSALAAVVMDATTGQVIYAKNAHQPRPIASTTKIITALVAIKMGQLDSVATVSPRAAGVEGSSIYLKNGEKLTLEELLYGALMRSGNDACVAIAEHVAGEEKMFVSFMNQLAQRLGARNSHFCNTNGLPNDQHVASAYDMALITRQALADPVFSRIVSSKTHSIAGPNGKRQLSNTNKMLWSYQGANGVKTGTTNAAGRCLVASATRGDRTLVAVVLHSDDRWGESVKLLNYGFSKSENLVAAGQGKPISQLRVKNGFQSKLPVTVDEDVVVTIPVGATDRIEKMVMLEHDLEAPLKPSQKVGELQIIVDGKWVAKRDLITLTGVERLPDYEILRQEIWHKIQRTMSALG